ncbi:MAG: hypothetical protein AAB903_04000 [Patescibacteria group bacterium]
MPAKKVVAIGGFRGAMAKGIIRPFFEAQGCVAIGWDSKDRGGPSPREVVAKADIVFLSVLPIAGVAETIESLAQFAKEGSLWLHGTSVQEPVGRPIGEALQNKHFVKRRVTTGFCHFKVGPSIRSLRGQSVICGFVHEPNRRWRKFLLEALEASKLKVVVTTPMGHDKLTAKSQGVPMVLALVLGQLLVKGCPSLPQVLQVAGPPFWLQMLGAFRSLGQPRVLGEILVNHPNSRRVIREAEEVLISINRACRDQDVDFLVRMAERIVTSLPKSKRSVIQDAIDWHTMTEGDLRGGAVSFIFSPEENKLGLLEKVLQSFSSRGLQKTSCLAKKTVDGGCQFYIGLEDPDHPEVKNACREIIERHGGERIAITR